MTRNERKKAYLKVLDLMEAGEGQIEAIREVFKLNKQVEFDIVLECIPYETIGEWHYATHEDDKNFIALCVALCDQPV